MGMRKAAVGVMAAVFALAEPGNAATCVPSEGFFRDTDVATVAACLDGSQAAAFLDARDGEFLTVLHFAAAYADDPEVIDLLREAAGDELWNWLLRARTKDDLTPLHLAARDAQDAETVVRMLGFGADPNVVLDLDDRWREDRGRTALHLAANRPDGAPFVTALLAGGADPSWRDSRGWPALLVAASIAERPEPVAAFFASSEVSPKAANGAADDEGNTALHVAVSYNRPLPVLRYLLLQGASVDSANEADVTALHMAAQFATEADAVAILLAHSAKPCLLDDEDQTPEDLLAGNEALREVAALRRAFHEACQEAAE